MRKKYMINGFSWYWCVFAKTPLGRHEMSIIYLHAIHYVRYRMAVSLIVPYFTILLVSMDFKVQYRKYIQCFNEIFKWCAKVNSGRFNLVSYVTKTWFRFCITKLHGRRVWAIWIISMNWFNENIPQPQLIKNSRRNSHKWIMRSIMFYALQFCLRKSKKALNKINEYFLHTIEVCHFIEPWCIACVKTIKLEHSHVRSYCCCHKLQCFPIFNIFIFQPLMTKVIS